MTRQQPEKVEQTQIVTLLRSLGASVYVLGTRRRAGDYQGTMMTAGIPDIYALLPEPRSPGDGRACGLWIEVKGKGGRVRPEQAAFAARCLERQLPHVVGGLDVVIRFLVTGGWLKSSNLPHYRHVTCAPIGAKEPCDVQ